MTDEELIAALGWEPCKSGGDAWCLTHGGYLGQDKDACALLIARIRAARAGMDLARSGIAAAIHLQTVRESPIQGEGLHWLQGMDDAESIARGWGR